MMKRQFGIIVLTSPGDIEDEADKIVKLLEAGVDRIHIRKPEQSAEVTEALIRRIPLPYRHRLSVHDAFEKALSLGAGGVHLNRRNPKEPEGVEIVSRSMHSPVELSEAGKYNYVTLSPIFDSISKEGYKSAFDFDSLSPAISSRRVFALGGVTPDKLQILAQKGFSGAGLLGYIWSGNFDDRLSNLRNAMEGLRQSDPEALPK